MCYSSLSVQTSHITGWDNVIYHWVKIQDKCCTVIILSKHLIDPLKKNINQSINRLRDIRYCCDLTQYIVLLWQSVLSSLQPDTSHGLLWTQSFVRNSPGQEILMWSNIDSNALPIGLWVSIATVTTWGIYKLIWNSYLHNHRLNSLG